VNDISRHYVFVNGLYDTDRSLYPLTPERRVSRFAQFTTFERPELRLLIDAIELGVAGLSHPTISVLGQ
jgi:hypothetical protein